MMPDKRVSELLDFYREAGVDAALGERPMDRFAVLEAPPPTRAPQQVSLPPDLEIKGRATLAVPPSPDVAAMAAREAAKRAKSLEELRGILEGFDGCALKATATRLVFADGNPQAKLMFVGEAPGRDEDLEGLPFVGRSGKLLDLMLAAIGLDRTKVYIANIVPWRPPGNRTPTPQEQQICLPFILRQIELVDPDILVCLGGLRRRLCSASRRESPRHADAGSLSTPGSGKSAHLRPFTPLFCCVARCKSGLPGATSSP